MDLLYTNILQTFNHFFLDMYVDPLGSHVMTWYHDEL